MPARSGALLGRFNVGGMLASMTRALDAVVAKLATLSSEEQDRIAQWAARGASGRRGVVATVRELTGCSGQARGRGPGRPRGRQSDGPRRRRAVKSRATPRFWASYHELPSEIKEAARKAYRLFREDPEHPSLQFKKVHVREPLYSARITLGIAPSVSVRATESPGSGSALTPNTTDSSVTCSSTSSAQRRSH